MAVLWSETDVTSVRDWLAGHRRALRDRGLPERSALHTFTRLAAVARQRRLRALLTGGVGLRPVARPGRQPNPRPSTARAHFLNVPGTRPVTWRYPSGTDVGAVGELLVGAVEAVARCAVQRARAAGRLSPETAYRPSRGEMPVVPVGPDDGVSALSGLVLGGTVTRRLKSADLFVSKNRKPLNLPRPGEITPDPAPASSR